MMNILAATAVALTCSVAKYYNLPITASAHLQEEAELARTEETEIGAYLILWDEKACQELADDQGALSDQRKEALDAACTKIIHFPKASESRYILLSQAEIRSRKPDIATLVWARTDGRNGDVRHQIILANSKGALRIDSPSYGVDGESKSECISTPWKFPAHEG